MKHFSNILFVPLTARNNPAAARRIADLARRNEAVLTEAGVVSDPSRLHRLLDRPLVATAIRDSEQQALVKKLDRWSRAAGYDHAERAILSGDTPLVVYRRADEA